jgi:LPXTG-motif cell wall-anchored protein
MDSKLRPRIQWRFMIYAVLYFGLFLFFYSRYVPMVRSFQIALVPVLILCFLLTSFNFKWGFLFFIFAFPLINSLPYFFGIYGNIPHAPAALVLFLVFFLGWLVNSVFSQSEVSFSHPIFKPLFLLSILILISGIITFLRYSNFFPFLADNVYELKTNVNGVSAGGAVMSVVFFALNYITGFALFFIILKKVKEKEFLKKVCLVLLISTFLSIGFGFYQHYGNIKLGNNPISFTQGFINGTFKDALSFGGYLAVVIPVLLSLVFFFKGILRIFSALVFLSALFILPNTGSRSGLVALAISLVFFLGFFLLMIKRQKSLPIKKVGMVGVTILLVFAVIASILLLSQGSVVYDRMNELWVSYKEGGLDKALAERSSSIWKAAGCMIKDYPLTGVGIGAFIIELPNYARLHEFPLRTTDSAENYFIQVFAELGIIGLFFALWIFWLIFKRMKKGFSQYLSRDRWKYMQIGVSCGIISMFLIFFVHTFIGSYELKYTFWLLVGMLFIMNRSEREAESKVSFSKKFRFISLGVVLIFTCFQLWNSTHSLSLEHRTEMLGLDQSFGFYDTETTKTGNEFRWSKKNSALSIKIEKPVMEIPLMASHPDIRGKPVKVKIYLIKDFFREERLLAEIVLTESSWKSVECPVPYEIDSQVILLFKVSRIWNPWEISKAPDTRNLGIALGEIKFSSE